MNLAVILNSIPEYIREQYPKFVDLINLYYSWLNENTDCANNKDFLENLEIFSDSVFLDNYLTDLGFYYKRDYKISKKLLITLLRDFYLNKGNAKSFEFVFKVFFGSDVTIEYPRDKVFTLSNATYSNEGFMFIRVNQDTINSAALQGLKVDISQYQSVIVKGLISGVTTQIEKIDELTKNNQIYLKLQISNIPIEQFNTFEAVNIVSDNWAISGILVNVSVLELVDKGKNFAVNDKLVFTTELSKDSDIRIKAVSKGSISKFNITYGGTNYVVGDKIRLSGESYGCLGQVAKVSSNGTIEGIKLWSGGYNLVTLPVDVYGLNGYQRAVTIDSTTGSGAILACESNDIGQILAWEIHEPHFDFNPTTQIKNLRTNEIINNFRIKDANIFINPKTFKNRKGFLGENSTLTDSLVFQQYAYSLKSNVSAYFYNDIVDDLLHPIGYIRLDILRLTDDNILTPCLSTETDNAILRLFENPPECIDTHPITLKNITNFIVGL